MAVVIAVSRRVGQVTFCVSSRTSCMNLNMFGLAMIGLPEDRRRRTGYRYRPIFSLFRLLSSVFCPLLLAGVEGLQPPTPGFGDRCSSQLSYTPIGALRQCKLGAHPTGGRRRAAMQGLTG